MNHDRRAFLEMAAAACTTVALGSRAAAAQAPPAADDLAWLPLSDVSELVRRRKVSPVDLTRACLARIERLNPRLNAFITVTAETALAEAKAAETKISGGQWRGRLHGKVSLTHA